MRTQSDLDALNQALLRENIAAITSEVFGDESFHLFRDRHQERVGGSPGIYEICIQAAAAFTATEPPDWDEHERRYRDTDWLIATERMAELVVACHDRVANEEYDLLARVAIYNLGDPDAPDAAPEWEVFDQIVDSHGIQWALEALAGAAERVAGKHAEDRRTAEELIDGAVAARNAAKQVRDEYHGY